MVEAHDVVIVGAGLAGAATAWHLAKRGVTDVVLLEKEAVPGMHSSGRNASMIREQVQGEAWQPLATRGAAFLRTAELAAFQGTGGMLLGLGDEDVSARVPLAAGRGLWCPGDGIVDVAALLASYLRDRDVRFGCTFRRWERAPDGLRLETDRGRLHARRLVNAAGSWAGTVGALDLVPLARHVYVTTRSSDVDPAWPFVWDLDAEFYFRPESGGWLLSPCDEKETEPGDYEEDESQLHRLAELVHRHQPGLGDLRVAHRWVGQRTFARDREPVVGFDPRENRLFHVAGLGGHGVTASYAVGDLAAARLVAGPEEHARYDPARLFR